MNTNILTQFIKNVKEGEQVKILKIEYNHHNNLCLFTYDILVGGYVKRCGFKLVNYKDMQDVTNKYSYYKNLFNNKFIA